MKREFKLTMLEGLFVASILIANVLASKLFEVGGYVMTAGIIAFPITFLLTDIINDVWGKVRAQRIVIVGLVANLMMVTLFQVGIRLNPAVFWGGQDAFQSTLGAVPRIVSASMVAYMISQTWDVWVFSKIKERMKLGLWFRNCVSTMTSQAIDSAIFLGLAFGGTMPLSNMMTMYVTYLIVKFMLAIIDTPFCYLGVAWARRGE